MGAEAAGIPGHTEKGSRGWQMVKGILGIFSPGEKLGPATLVLRAECLEEADDFLICLFYLAGCLWVIPGCETHRHPKLLHKALDVNYVPRSLTMSSGIPK